MKGKLEVIAPYLRHSHAAKVITIFQNTSRYGRKKYKTRKIGRLLIHQ
nr:MAG TPA: hypothetical protein [Bacteriophage sp.]